LSGQTEEETTTMRRSMIVAVLTAAVASFAGLGSASAQVGVEVYVGPPAYTYGPGPYVQYGYEAPAYGYSEPYVVTYPRRFRCGPNRSWNGNHCVDINAAGTGQP
jgi:hypothetical protein